MTVDYLFEKAIKKKLKQIYNKMADESEAGTCYRKLNSVLKSFVMAREIIYFIIIYVQC